MENVRTTSSAYCTMTERLQHWDTRPGYALNDTRPKERHKGTVMYWKNVKQVMELDETDIWGEQWWSEYEKSISKRKISLVP